MHEGSRVAALRSDILGGGWVYRVSGGSDRFGIGNERIPGYNESGRLRERTTQI